MYTLIIYAIPRSTKRFGPDGKRFEHLSFLNLAQNVVCLVWSFISTFPSPITLKFLLIFLILFADYV